MPQVCKNPAPLLEAIKSGAVYVSLTSSRPLVSCSHSCQRRVGPIPGPLHTPIPTQIPGQNAILMGAAWYPEQWPESRWEEDLRLMEAANLKVVRIAEFAWSRMEPSEGHYDFDWLERAINLAGQASHRFRSRNADRDPARMAHAKISRHVAHRSEWTTRYPWQPRARLRQFSALSGILPPNRRADGHPLRT